jgi:endonuclease YncB( thermonuclease family)
VASLGVLAGTTPAISRFAFAASGSIRSLAFDSTASLLAADHTPLTDESVIAVWAEQTARTVDEDGDGDAVIYPDSVRIPLVASDGTAVGFGAPIVQDETDFTQGNEEFVLNILDRDVGSGTVLWDEGHSQYYDLGKFEAFADYAREHGYAVRATTDLMSDLSNATAVAITSPAEAFTTEELDALAAFASDGGSVLLFHQSDFGDYDETANINAIAERLGLAFRFNDDQVLDNTSNAGIDFVPVTDEFNDRFEYFTDREGIDFEIDPEKTYTVDVIEVTDGDTVDVSFPDGHEETIRVLGIDTPEVPAASAAERPEEWEGLESLSYLGNEGNSASAFAKDHLSGVTADVTFDANEPVRDVFGRLLAYVRYDDGSGARETLYNRQAIEAGHARVYDSSFVLHDEFIDTERRIRAVGRGLWNKSDPKDSQMIRNDPVESMFIPRAASVRTNEGRIDDKRVPVYAAETAEQQGGSVSYQNDIPLVGIDQHAGVAMIGSPLIDEQYERDEGYPVDTSDYGNFSFLTSLVDRLSNLDGFSSGTDTDTDTVLIDGGHGQFGAPSALSAEDAAYYLRYLEGVDLSFEQVNTLSTENLSRGRALLVTSPVSAFTDDELEAVQDFVTDGGGVVLMGGDVPVPAREHLNAIAEALCSDLRMNWGRVIDRTHNLTDDPSVPVTSNFDRWFRLFGGYDPNTHYRGARGGPGIPGCHIQ